MAYIPVVKVMRPHAARKKPNVGTLEAVAAILARIPKF
jgi:hypothetical protein